jgi:hypothetical protein
MQIVGLLIKIITNFILSIRSATMAEVLYLDLELIYILRSEVTTYLISAI